MRVKLLQTGAHAPWQEGEIVTVQVVTIDDAGAYECETLETYPADIKERHAEQVASMQTNHETQITALREQHDRELAEARKPPEPEVIVEPKPA